jgi:hypothetical protein
VAKLFRATSNLSSQVIGGDCSHEWSNQGPEMADQLGADIDSPWAGRVLKIAS